MSKKTAKDISHLGSEFRKAQPKLRMVANGNSEVNEKRAMQCGAVAVTNDIQDKSLKPVDPASIISTTSKKSVSQADKGKLKKLPTDVFVNVFIESTRHYEPGSLTSSHKTIPADIAKDDVTTETGRTGNLVTARVRMSDLPKLLESSNVKYVELAENLRVPNPDITNTTLLQPNSKVRNISYSKNVHKYGEDVIIGIIDVGGFDFSHEDFLDKYGDTRFLGIWDQGGSSRSSPFEARKDTDDPIPEIYNYGSEILAEHMNAAISAAPKIGIPATELEPQSQMSTSSHGTHVASIAAGKKGVASKAMIAAVLVNIPDEAKSDYATRRRSFYDSTQIAHAVDYLMTLARGRPISINVSLGTNGHAHDGTSPVCRWIDAWLNSPGVAISVAAGNAGQEAAKTDDDMGYIMGRIHTSGQILSRGLISDIEWQVIGNGEQDISENELEIWYSAQDQFSVQVRPPGMDWTEEIKPHEFIENRQLKNKSFLSIYNERYHPANGLNCISIYLSPYMKDDTYIGSMSGLWKVRLRGIEIRDGRFHGWIERDDPRQVPTGDGKSIWFLPSFFSERSNVYNSSVSSLACGQRIISVANLDEPNEAINLTSSQGPTRDGRAKPDIAAPGTEIIAAKGFSSDKSRWVSMSGTSMAAPYVTGVIALMLSVNKRLTAAQIAGIIQSTAEPLPGGSYEWIDSAGFGRINPRACLKEAQTIAVNENKDMT